MSNAGSERSFDRALDAQGARGGPAARAPVETRSWRALLSLWGPVVVYLAVIFVGSSFPTLPDIPGGFSDKAAHAGEYAVLGLLLTRALAGPRWLSAPLASVAGAVALAALCGLSDEYHQLFVPGRTFDLKDLLADVTGASLSVAALSGWVIIRRFWGVLTRQP